MATLNTAAVFEDVVDLLNIWISQIMTDFNVIGTVIDEQAYREFERNNPVGTLFPGVELPSGFQVTTAQRNRLVLIFFNVATTHDALNVSEVSRLIDSLARRDPNEAIPLASLAQVVVFLAERALTRSMTSVALDGTIFAGDSGCSSGSGQWSGFWWGGWC